MPPTNLPPNLPTNHVPGGVIPSIDFNDLAYAANAVPASDVDALEAKVGTGASAPTAETVLTGTGTGTSLWLPKTPMTTLGDMIRGAASGIAQRVGIGTPGQVWTVVAGIPAWATLPAGGGGAVGAMEYTVAASDAGALFVGRSDYQCDGVADNVQIQAALNAAAVTRGTVKLSPGNYQISADMNVWPHTSLIGAGRSATRLFTTNHAVTPILLNSWGAVKNFWIEGPGVRDLTPGTGQGRCLNCSGATDVLIDDMLIEKSCGQAVICGDNTLRGRIRHTEIRFAGDEGFYGGIGCDDWSVVDLYVHDNQKCGFDWGGARYRFDTIHFKNNGLFGDGADEEDCLINGRTPRSSTDGTMTNCIFEGGGQWSFGVRYTNEGEPLGITTNHVLSNSTFRGKYIGVNARSFTHHLEMSNLTIDQSTFWGVDIEGGQDIELSNVRVRRSAGHGFVLRSEVGGTSAQRVRMLGCTSRDNGLGGGPNSVPVGTGAGLRIDDPSIIENDIHDNSFYNNPSGSLSDGSGSITNHFANNRGIDY